jgi:hypothetical protein
VVPSFVLPDQMLGISKDFDATKFPINGLRHPAEANTCGWYIWSGNELSQAEDFFVPVHASHLEDYCAEATEFLALPPGWRFLFAPDHRDVWFDPKLLDLS